MAAELREEGRHDATTPAGRNRPTDVTQADPADPFGTAALRDGTLLAWRSSPTRLREDTATESDLVRAGYRDRVLTELAQNAADAATRASITGAMRVWIGDDGLHVANTGSPLDGPGVQALTALRASAKTGGVGRFGVGFTAVLAVSDDIEIRSRTGSIRFSAERTRTVLREHGNMSSPSVLFALDRAIATANGDRRWWLTAFGAGFAAHACELWR